MLGIILTILSSFAFSADFLPATFSADYQEVGKSSVNGKEKIVTGRIDYKYPRHLRLEVSAPDALTFVTNPKTSWYYTPPFMEPEQGQVVIQKSTDIVYGQFFDAIKDGTKVNRSYVSQVVGKEWTLTFNPDLQKSLKIKSVRLVHGVDAAKASSLSEFKEMWLSQQDGKTVRLVFLNFRSGVPFPADHFEFKIPPNTKVSGGK
jgi:outer membrane lipoprotein-sorting protein